MADAPTTCAVDVGATSIKACLLGADGTMEGSISKRRAQLPMGPDELVAIVGQLFERSGSADRMGLGFPGMVRDGIVLDPANYARSDGPGSELDHEVLDTWRRFDLRAAIAEALGVEVRVANDADVAALGCASGVGVELTVTLGSGVGTGLTVDGVLQAHLELSEIELDGVKGLDAVVGEQVRKRVGDVTWCASLCAVLAQLDRIVVPDRIYVTGGNARRICRDDLGALLAKLWVVTEPVGLLGAAKLFS